ncbi:putative phage tail protein [Bacillus manliponensis]|uniref:putative phage tail protein n=1 Tax=Bacillus manliponensis TaxID=574376 RepID=UPI003519C069
MHAIKEQEWGQIKARTWGDLQAHQWSCFRLALMESSTELEVQGVTVVQSGAVNETFAGMETQGVRVEHSPIVIETVSEMITSIVVSRRDYKTDMLKMLPLYERKSDVFHNILTADDREFRNLEQQIDIVDRNIFIDTAVESLHIHERDLGIKTVENLRYDQRREQIMSRNRANVGQTTEDTIKLVARAFSNGEVDVNKTAIPGVYEVKFIDKIGIPDNIESLKESLDIVIPAHLELTYSFTFNVWDAWKGKRWSEVASKTWDDLRNWNEVSS